MPAQGHRHFHRTDAFDGRRSRFYDVMSRRLFRGLYRRLAADVAATAPQGATVLDIGTGPGVLLMELAKRRPDLRLIGVDVSADMVAAAERNLSGVSDRAQVRVADVADLPFDDASVDLVVSSLSAHHWEDIAGAANQIARVLRPGGRLCVYDLHFAPFQELTEAAQATSRFADAPRQTRFRTRIPFLPRCVRYELTATD